MQSPKDDPTWAELNPTLGTNVWLRVLLIVLCAKKLEENLSKLFDFLFRATGLERCDIIFDGGSMDGRWIDSVIEVLFVGAKAQIFRRRVHAENTTRCQVAGGGGRPNT